MMKACTVLAAALAAVQALPGPGGETAQRGRVGCASGKHHTSVNNNKGNDNAPGHSVDFEISHNNQVLVENGVDDNQGNTINTEGREGDKVRNQSGNSKASGRLAGVPPSVSADGFDEPVYSHNGPIVKLTPSVHWSVNTKVAANVVPLPAKEPSQLYYGVNDPTQAGHFAVINYTFTAPSVNLEHSAYVSATYIGASSSLSIKFSDNEAFQLARASWKVEQGLILIANAEGCSQGDMCYFKVASMEMDEKNTEIIVQGKASHPDELIEKGETEWGYWSPEERSGTSDAKGEPKKPGETFEWGKATPTSAGGRTQTTAPAKPGPGRNGSFPEPGMRSAEFSAPHSCVAPPDTKYGLPTACLDEYFDEMLDDIQGYGDMSGMDHNLLMSVAPALMENMAQYAGTPLTRRGVVVKRWWPWKLIVKQVTNAYKAVQDLLTIRGSINQDLSFRMPDPKAKDEKNNKVMDKEAMHVMSPWGDSVLLKSFGQQMAGKDKMLTGYLNIFCVECGVKGSAMVAGRAAWTPLGGFRKGRVELRVDIKFALKLGIDAQVVYRHDFEKNLFSVGLPGLSYGVVTIGPHISVNTRVSFEAAARGQLLAGAEMGLKDARIVIDLVDASRTEHGGWEPYFQPVLEAQGELMLAAELGLPIGIKCGLKIASWDKSVGLINEPSIRAVAQIAASIGQTDSGRFSAGFDEKNGCAGIGAQLTWRNRLWVDVLGWKQYNLHDTKDRPVARGCISLPSHKVRRQLPGLQHTNSSDGLPGWRHTNSSGDVVDMTSALRDSAFNMDPEPYMLSYEPGEIHDMAYNMSDGVEYQELINSAGDTMVVACSDGNIYPVMANGKKHPACSNLWGLEEGVVVHDGNEKIMHVYDNSLDKLGVSRLRVRGEDSMPNMARVVVAPVWNPPNGEGTGMVVLADRENILYYLIACDYEDPEKNPSKVFVAKDPDQASVLEDPDLMYSVTGGKVKQCLPLVVTHDMKQDSPDYMNGMGKEMAKSGVETLALAAGYQMDGSMHMS